MTQEDKKHILKDLCDRLPYGVKVHAKYTDLGETIEVDGIVKMIDDDGVVGIEVICDTNSAWTYVQIDNIKPYLFPLSIMTEEQWKEYQTLKMTDWVEGDINGVFINAGTITDWLNKNHFDYRGLIQMGLAINATRLNIY